jgi:hypothetical protein
MTLEAVLAAISLKLDRKRDAGAASLTEWGNTIDAHLAKHAEMAANLRELSKQMQNGSPGDMPWDFCDGLNDILDAHPSPAPTAVVSDGARELRARHLYDTELRRLGIDDLAYHVGCGAELEDEELAAVRAICAAMTGESP